MESNNAARLVVNVSKRNRVVGYAVWLDVVHWGAGGFRELLQRADRVDYVSDQFPRWMGPFCGDRSRNRSR